MQDPKPFKSSSTSDFEFLGKLGKGSFGVVYKVKRKIDKNVYVLKQINISQMNQRLKTAALNEVNILSALDNPYIVKYFDSFVEKNILNIVMEFCEGGDLANYIRNQMGRPLNENKIWKFLIQTCIGLDYIHSRKILHRDIKSLNIFLSKDEDIRIGDLGVAKMLAESANFAHTMVGTPYYLSPEMCEERPYNEKSDVWAFGCVLYEMCTQKHPFEANNQASLILKIIRGKYAPIPTTYSPELIECVDLCLCKDFKKRPTATQLLAKSVIINKAKNLNINLKGTDDKKTANSERSNKNDQQDKKERQKSDKVSDIKSVNSDIKEKELPKKSQPIQQDQPVASSEPKKKNSVNVLNEEKAKNIQQPLNVKKPEPSIYQKIEKEKFELKNNQIAENNLLKIHNENKLFEVKNPVPNNNNHVVRSANVLINPKNAALVNPNLNAQKLLKNPSVAQKKDKASSKEVKQVIKQDQPQNLGGKEVKADDSKKNQKNIAQPFPKPPIQAGQQKLIKEAKYDPQPAKISRPILLSDKEKPPKVDKNDKNKGPSISDITTEEINEIKNLPDNLYKNIKKPQPEIIPANDSDDNKQLSRPKISSQSPRADNIPYKTVISRPSTSYKPSENEVPSNKSSENDLTSPSSMKLAIEKQEPVKNLRPASRNQSVMSNDAITNPETSKKDNSVSTQYVDSDNLEIYNVDQDTIPGEDEKIINDSNESEEEVYVEEEDTETIENDIYENRNGDDENEEEKTDNKNESENYEESTETITNNLDKEALRQAIETKLTQYKERQQYLENIIKQRVSECCRQLGEANYLEIINFFRGKLKIDGDLTEQDQDDIDEFIQKKVKANSKADVVYNIYKILHLELENDKCKENIKRCNFELV